MFKAETISIIIPTYNRLNEIRKCVSSILSQKINPVTEIIICDDSNNNKTEEYFNSLKSSSENLKIKYIKNEKPLGPGGNRNKGVQNSSGQIIGFIDDDCYFVQGAFEKIVEEMKDTGILRYKIEIFEKENITFYTHQPSIKDFGEKDYGGLFFVRREVFEAIGGFEATFFDKKRNIHFREDTEFFFRAFDMGIKDKYIDETLAVHPVFKGNFNKPFKEIFRLKYDLAFEKKWKKYLVEGNIFFGIRITPKKIKIALGSLQIISFILMIFDWKLIGLYLLFHLLHFVFYARYVKKFIIKEILFMNVQLLVIPYYTLYIYILSWIFFIKLKLKRVKKGA